jgi:RND family efflux transporter MFP subunit
MSRGAKSIIIVGTSLLLLLASCGRSSEINLTSTPSVASPRPTYTVDARINAKGVLVPKYTAMLAFTISGRVQTVMVDIGDRVYKGDALVQLETVALEAEVAKAESAIQVAQSELDYQKRTRGAQEMQTVAEVNVRLAEIDLARAQNVLAQATLIAPMDGTVVDIQVLPGEVANEGRAIITLANLDIFQVETLDLDELKLPQVNIGQDVEVYIEALDISVDGTVERIIPKASSFDDENVYKAIIRLNSQPRGLFWGMSVDASFYPEK